MKAPEKIYMTPSFGEPDNVLLASFSKSHLNFNRDVEYTRTDAFIEKALKWYCLDCACSDNCAANHKCAFWSSFKDYLEGNDKALPPKISNALNPDASVTENYRYRHFIRTVRDAFIEKACDYWYKHNSDIVKSHGAKAVLGCSEFTVNVEDFKKYMKGE